MTLAPDICRATAKLTDTVVLPTPPLPLAMPITSVRLVLSIEFSLLEAVHQGVGSG